MTNRQPPDRPPPDAQRGRPDNPDSPSPPNSPSPRLEAETRPTVRPATDGRGWLPGRWRPSSCPCPCGCRSVPLEIDDPSCARHRVHIGDPDRWLHTGMFIAHEGGVRVISLREAREWAA